MRSIDYLPLIKSKSTIKGFIFSNALVLFPNTPTVHFWGKSKTKEGKYSLIYCQNNSAWQ